MDASCPAQHHEEWHRAVVYTIYFARGQRLAAGLCARLEKRMRKVFASVFMPLELIQNSEPAKLNIVLR